MYDFDKRLPDTTTYWIENQIFFIRNTNFYVTQEEGHAMAELLIFAMQHQQTSAIVFDNHQASGVWPAKISEIWEKNQQYKSLVGNKRIATLTNSAIKKLQTNRLSKELGIDHISKAFYSNFNDEVLEFLLGEDME